MKFKEFQPKRNNRDITTFGIGYFCYKRCFGDDCQDLNRDWELDDVNTQR